MSKMYVQNGLVLDFFNLKQIEARNSKIIDKSRKNNHGTIYGAIWINNPNFVSLRFDGVNDYVEVPDNLTLRHSIVSLFLWVKKLGTSNGSYPLLGGKYDASVGGYGLFFNISDQRVYAYIRKDAVNTYSVADTIILPFGVWYCYALTFDGSILKLYRNGFLVASTSAIMTAATTPVWIGGRKDRDAYFSGLISEVCIYNRVLTSAEIKRNYYNSKIYKQLRGLV